MKFLHFGISSKPGNGGDEEQGQPFIASEVLQNLSYMSIQEMRHFWANLTQHNEIYHGITAKNHTKILDFSSTLSVKNGVLWCDKSHSLLLTYLKTLLEYIYKKEHVYKVLNQPLWCDTGP